MSDDALLASVYEIACHVARVQFRFETADAEEIGQEMMLRAFHQMTRASINRTWVFRGARYLCIDRVRARNSEAQALQRLERSGQRRHHSGLTTAVELQGAIDGLPWECQSLIKMYFWEGRTWAEIDSALGQGHRCAQYRTRKCIDVLRSRLKGLPAALPCRSGDQ